MTMHGDIDSIAHKLLTSRRVVVLTGAGVSKESGIPTFREAQTGVWANYDPETLATPQGFMNDPGLVWRWYESRRQMLAEVTPNLGHMAIAELEQLVPEVTVITQNIDRLHAKAGSTSVVELHGNLVDYICFDNRHPANEVSPGLAEPPKCWCGSLMRPAVVWFGEALPPHALESASVHIRSADIVFVAGTSGIVQPAASLPYIAKQAGIMVIEVNPNPTPISEIADILLQGPSGEIFPQLVKRLRELRNDRISI